ncbi:NAD-dependent epimerase/dehydratase family protein [Marinobacterium weihaiense]|uniref:NAD-dependent epimerase/dehydratase family protein n=1 Tax=Marinobacterium weihaiense TaxID=2851016 RepID=A0ABS6ME59_9GAMM|nr:NAD-dependent epimerase/dehydratase family protein [Marinobacterium weihaiense]MBV0934606.1 NAD-dependent epimerase/dehydratase family protein [Marinobacterium weihaiense]
MNILLTGATGFVGHRMLQVMKSDEYWRVTAAARQSLSTPGVCSALVGHIDGHTAWQDILSGQQVVIHAAGRAHMAAGSQPASITEYREVNVEGTVNLARQAAAAGVERFVFISSIGVNGSHNQHPFTETDTPSPVGPYAISKWEAEQALWRIQRDTGMEVVIIRPPLVYGPNAPGNFGALVRWVERGVPLPLGAVHNQRTLVARDNLVDLVLTCARHPAAANQLFLAGDDEDLSTTDLLKGVAQAAGRPSRLVPVPASVLMFGASLLGRRAMAQRLLGSLQVDIQKARHLLGWAPPVSVAQGLNACFV